MINSMLPLPGLSPVCGKSVVATFDGGLLSSDGSVLMLREVEQRLRIADRFAGWIEDQRAPDQITHALADIIRFRLLMIAAGYEDGNDANGLRVDPIFKMALDLSRLTASCCSRRREEDDDQDSPADVVPRPGYFASRVLMPQPGGPPRRRER